MATEIDEKFEIKDWFLILFYLQRKVSIRRERTKFMLLQLSVWRSIFREGGNLPFGLIFFIQFTNNSLQDITLFYIDYEYNRKLQLSDGLNHYRI